MSAAVTKSPTTGAQRLPIERLRQWQSLEYGMFIHFGMSTFVGKELPDGSHPASTYDPDRLDVDQWVRVARDAGMKYAVLTAKHVAGHCLWPSEQTDYHVGNSGDTTDVVGAFVEACGKHGIVPGLYYCCWDNHHRFGSVTPTDTHLRWGEELGFRRGLQVGKQEAYTTPEYQQWQLQQIEELLTRYGPIGEVWIDIPGVLGPVGRRALYDHIVELQPDTAVMMNHGLSDGLKLDVNYVWPTDLMTIERNLPASRGGHGEASGWYALQLDAGEPKDYFVPAEVCDTIGRSWFYENQDQPRSIDELAGMRMISRSRGANLLLNVPPDRSGRIPDRYIAALQRVRQTIEAIR